MKTKSKILGLVGLVAALMALPSYGTDLLCDVHNLASGQIVNRKVTLTYESAGPFVAGNWLVAGDFVSQFTTNNGQTTFSNVLAGVYRLDIAGNPPRSFAHIGIPSTNGLINVATLLPANTVPTNLPTPTFYTASQVDALIAELNSVIDGISGGSGTVDATQFIGATNGFATTPSLGTFLGDDTDFITVTNFGVDQFGSTFPINGFWWNAGSGINGQRTYMQWIINNQQQVFEFNAATGLTFWNYVNATMPGSVAFSVSATNGAVTATGTITTRSNIVTTAGQFIGNGGGLTNLNAAGNGLATTTQLSNATNLLAQSTTNLVNNATNTLAQAISNYFVLQSQATAMGNAISNALTALQPGNLKLTNFSGLANASGVLTNNGSGTLSWVAVGGGVGGGSSTVFLPVQFATNGNGQVYIAVNATVTNLNIFGGTNDGIGLTSVKSNGPVICFTNTVGTNHITYGNVQVGTTHFDKNGVVYDGNFYTQGSLTTYSNFVGLPDSPLGAIVGRNIYAANKLTVFGPSFMAAVTITNGLTANAVNTSTISEGLVFGSSYTITDTTLFLAGIDATTFVLDSSDISTCALDSAMGNSGRKVIIINDTVADVSLPANESDASNIWIAGSLMNGATLPAGGAVTLQSDGAGNWYLLSGTLTP